MDSHNYALENNYKNYKMALDQIAINKSLPLDILDDILGNKNKLDSFKNYSVELNSTNETNLTKNKGVILPQNNQNFKNKSRKLNSTGISKNINAATDFLGNALVPHNKRNYHKQILEKLNSNEVTKSKFCERELDTLSFDIATNFIDDIFVPNEKKNDGKHESQQIDSVHESVSNNFGMSTACIKNFCVPEMKLSTNKFVHKNLVITRENSMDTIDHDTDFIDDVSFPIKKENLSRSISDCSNYETFDDPEAFIINNNEKFQSMKNYVTPIKNMGGMSQSDENIKLTTADENNVVNKFHAIEDQKSSCLSSMVREYGLTSEQNNSHINSLEKYLEISDTISEKHLTEKSYRTLDPGSSNLEIIANDGVQEGNKTVEIPTKASKNLIKETVNIDLYQNGADIENAGSNNNNASFQTEDQHQNKKQPGIQNTLEANSEITEENEDDFNVAADIIVNGIKFNEEAISIKEIKDIDNTLCIIEENSQINKDKFVQNYKQQFTENSIYLYNIPELNNELSNSEEGKFCQRKYIDAVDVTVAINNDSKLKDPVCVDENANLKEEIPITFNGADFEEYWKENISPFENIEIRNENDNLKGDGMILNKKVLTRKSHGRKLQSRSIHTKNNIATNFHRKPKGKTKCMGDAATQTSPIEIAENNGVLNRQTSIFQHNICESDICLNSQFLIHQRSESIEPCDDLEPGEIPLYVKDPTKLERLLENVPKGLEVSFGSIFNNGNDELEEGEIDSNDQTQASFKQHADQRKRMKSWWKRKMSATLGILTSLVPFQGKCQNHSDNEENEMNTK